MCLLACLLYSSIFVAFPRCACFLSPSLPTDYELVGPPQVVLSAGASFSVNIAQDNQLEMHEMFSIILSTTDESVKIKQRNEKYTVVIINMDMDGM